MELEEAIKTLNSYKKAFVFETEPPLNDYAEAVETVLHYIKEESIPRAVVEEKIEEIVKEANFRTTDNPKGRVHFVPEPEDYQIMILQEILNKGE